MYLTTYCIEAVANTLHWSFAVRSILSERGHNPYLASTSAEELTKQLRGGEQSLLSVIMTPMSRPIRIVRGKDIDGTAKIDDSLFEHEEEEALLQAYLKAQDQVW